MEKTKNSYKKSGVNITLANSFVKHIANISRKNVSERVLPFQSSKKAARFSFSFLVFGWTAAAAGDTLDFQATNWCSRNVKVVKMDLRT